MLRRELLEAGVVLIPRLEVGGLLRFQIRIALKLRILVLRIRIRDLHAEPRHRAGLPNTNVG